MLERAAADDIFPVVAPHVAMDEGLLVEAAVNADEDGLVPSAVLVEAGSATVEGSGVPVVLEIDKDERFNSAKSEVLVGTGADVAMIPVGLDHVDIRTRVLTACAIDDAPLLKTCVDGVGVTVHGMLEVFDHVNASVAATRAAKNDVLLLEAAANANVEVLAPPVVLANAISAITESSGVPEFAVPTTRGVCHVEGDELPNPARAEVRAGTGAVVAMIPVMLSHADASALVLIAAANDDALLLKTCVNGVVGVIPVIPEMAADVNASVVASRATENEVLLCN